MVNGRCDYAPVGEIVDDVRAALETHPPDEVDWVTFVGSGEPTLHAGLGVMIRKVKALSRVPVAVITNGSLLYLPEVREDLMAADAVLPSLDAGSERLFRAINRPHPAITFERQVEGLIEFGSAYEGSLRIEVMLIQGLNDSEDALLDLRAVLGRIRLDELHLSQPVRPPAERWVAPPDADGLMRATAILGEVARIIHPVEGEFDLTGYGDVLDAVVEVITRHPMRQDELVVALERWSPGSVARALDTLAARGRARPLKRFGHRFWTAAGARYGDSTARRRHDGASAVNEGS
jgi:wyosine [tRNA(Phe)-imidazoG37] synthetase (radical SAM superfamily)